MFLSGVSHGQGQHNLGCLDTDAICCGIGFTHSIFICLLLFSLVCLWPSASCGVSQHSKQWRQTPALTETLQNIQVQVKKFQDAAKVMETQRKAVLRMLEDETKDKKKVKKNIRKDEKKIETIFMDKGAPQPVAMYWGA